MKLDTMNIMMSNMNINNSLQSDNAKPGNDFMNILNKSENEKISDSLLLDKDESKDLEEILMELVVMMIEKNTETIDINNLDNMTDYIEETLSILDYSSKSEIIDGFSINKYFQGNDTKIQEIINLLNDTKHENGIDEVNILLDRLKDKLVGKDEQNNPQNDFVIKHYPDKLSIINKADENFVEDIFKMDSNASGIINSVKIEEQMKNSKNKEISILQEIGKDDSNSFIPNQNVNRIVSELDTPSSKTNIPNEVRSSNFTQDIIQSINYLNNNNIQELKINLNPKELGEISIRIIKSEKETKLSIVVAKDEVYSLVNKNLQEISNHLENLDIKVNEIAVDIKSDNQNDFSDNLNQQFKEQKERRQSNGNEKDEQTEIENISSANIDNINLLA